MLLCTENLQRMFCQETEMPRPMPESKRETSKNRIPPANAPNTPPKMKKISWVKLDVQDIAALLEINMPWSSRIFLCILKPSDHQWHNSGCSTAQRQKSPAEFEHLGTWRRMHGGKQLVVLTLFKLSSKLLMEYSPCSNRDDKQITSKLSKLPKFRGESSHPPWTPFSGGAEGLKSQLSCHSWPWMGGLPAEHLLQLLNRGWHW